MRRLAWLLATVLVTAPSSAFAQATATTGQIEGVITDPQGAALPGVSVTARNVGTGFERTATSDETGLYRLSLLPLGTYELTAALQGFTTIRRERLVLQVNETMALPISMQLAALAETLTITAQAPVVEVTRSQSAVTLNDTAISSLPINGRRFQDFVLLTPGGVRAVARRHVDRRAAWHQRVVRD
jgi:hypothetical protein